MSTEYARTPSVEVALHRLAALIRNQAFHAAICPDVTRRCHDWMARQLDAASLTYDLAVAEAARDLTRRGVAW